MLPGEGGPRNTGRTERRRIRDRDEVEEEEGRKENKSSIKGRKEGACPCCSAGNVALYYLQTIITKE